jgi:hypothetical protein
LVAPGRPDAVLMLHWLKGRNPLADNHLGRAVHPLGDRQAAGADAEEETV